MLKKIRKVTAAAYWIFTAIVFIVGLYQPNNEGGIPTVVVTLPWSVPMLLGLSVLDSISLLKPILDLLGTSIGNFIMLPFLCGGMNALLIFGFENLADLLYGDPD